MISNCMNRKGFSLAEAIMATVVLSIAAAGVLLPFVSGAAVQAEGVHRTLAAKLASDLMEEITATPFAQVVDSYDAYTEPQGQVKDANGVVFADSRYGSFSIEVSCEYVYVPQESATRVPEFILATVRIYYNGRQITVINRLIGK